MAMKESLDTLYGMASDAAQAAARKTKQLAEIAKANLSIYAEEDKIKKAQVELGSSTTGTTSWARIRMRPSICPGARRSTNPSRPLQICAIISTSSSTAA